MMEFKKYLETNSTKLSQSQQYIPFYALPYIPDPKNHSLFKETFTVTISSKKLLKNIYIYTF